MEQLSSLLPLLLLLVMLYVLVIRPAKARQREALSLQAALAPGQEVITTSGLYATVVSVADGDEVVLETASGVTSRWVKAAVGRIVTPLEPPRSASEEEIGARTEEGVDHNAPQAPASSATPSATP